MPAANSAAFFSAASFALAGGLFAAPHGKTGWYQKFVNRWKAGRKPNAPGLELGQTEYEGMCANASKLIASGFKMKVKEEEAQVM